MNQELGPRFNTGNTPANPEVLARGFCELAIEVEAVTEAPKPAIIPPSISPLHPRVSDEAVARINAKYKRPPPPRGFIRSRDPLKHRRLR